MINKILFCGLDNAGKTSIIYTLKKQYNFLSDLKPTMGIKRKKHKVLGIEFILWDLGGQKTYRDNYFKREEFIFSDVGLLIYVIDIQDEERFEDIEKYYKKIINSIEKYQATPSITILFHKMDPDLEFDPKMKMFEKDIKKRLKSISNKFDVTFFKTSVYRRYSLINAFSYSLRKLSDKSEGNIVQYLKDWAKVLDVTSLILLNNEDVIIGEYFKNEDSYQAVEEIMDNIISLSNESFKSQEPVIIKKPNSIIGIDPIKIGKHDLILIKFSNKPENFEKLTSYTIDFSQYPNIENILNDYFKKI